MGGGERAYVYAKACGIIGKSFVGRRIAALRPISRLSELDRLIFSGDARELPERELLPDLEQRLSRRSVAAILSIVDSYKNPPEFLLRLLRVYEYADLKTALALISAGSVGTAAAGSAGTKPDFIPLGRFSTVHFETWPDPAAMVNGTEFEFLIDKGKLKDEFDGISLETALDRHYYRRLWKSLGQLRPSDRMAAEKIITEEIALRNCSWILRLRTYYGMNSEETAARLITIEGNPRLSAEAEAVLELPLDNREAWNGWKRAAFLNPTAAFGAASFGAASFGPAAFGAASFGAERLWRADPRYFQNAASEYLYRLTIRSFRQRPASMDTPFCFIKLKQFEEDLLTSNAEGLGMGMTGRDVLAMLEKSL
ncbi:hypothetical protein AGMMS50230_20260 [Spirochaetia bacterium]|nr:hypothetical protein AGMMS50230_20260 [Spirochaetia bacterium]